MKFLWSNLWSGGLSTMTTHMDISWLHRFFGNNAKWAKNTWVKKHQGATNTSWLYKTEQFTKHRLYTVLQFSDNKLREIRRSEILFHKKSNVRKRGFLCWKVYLDIGNTIKSQVEYSLGLFVISITLLHVLKMGSWHEQT